MVAEAGDGYEAVREAERTRPDLVLMDIRMPRQDGLAAAWVIRERLPGTQVVILTGFDAPHYRAEAEAAGCSGYLLKDAVSQALIAGALKATRGE